jgi:hypothetical protein
MPHTPHKFALIQQLQWLPQCAGPVLPDTMRPASKHLTCGNKQQSELRQLICAMLLLSTFSWFVSTCCTPGECTGAPRCMPAAIRMLSYTCLCTCYHGCLVALFHYLIFQDLHQSTFPVPVDICINEHMCWCVCCSCRSPPIRLDCRGTRSRRVLGAALCCNCRGSMGCAGSPASCRITGLGLYVLLSYFPVVSSMLSVAL